MINCKNNAQRRKGRDKKEPQSALYCSGQGIRVKQVVEKYIKTSNSVIPPTAGIQYVYVIIDYFDRYSTSGGTGGKRLFK